MRINKKLELALRREFAALKKRVKTQERQNMKFARSKCRNLVRCLKKRWDYDVKEQLFSEEAHGDINSLIHDFRND